MRRQTRLRWKVRLCGSVINTYARNCGVSLVSGMVGGDSSGWVPNRTVTGFHAVVCFLFWRGVLRGSSPTRLAHVACSACLQKNAVQNPYEPRSKHAKTTLVKTGRFVHKTLQNDKVHLKTDNPSAVYDHTYATNSKHCKTIRSNSKPMTSIFC